MASPVQPIRDPTSPMESSRPVPALTNDLLEEIFLRVGAPADLARASTACVAFRRLIADPSFVRRYRSVHGPLLLGFIDPDDRRFQPTETPHPSAAVARAVASAADFSFEDYLPRVTGARWHLCDVRDRLVLFRCFPVEEGEEKLAVCDPLAKRCLLLPPISDDLLACVQHQTQDIEKFHALLLPSGYEEDDTSFRVMARIDFREMVGMFIFSSATGHWSAGTSVRWDALSLPPGHRLAAFSSYAYGCFYWEVLYYNKLLKFDVSSMEFSTVDIQLQPERDKYAIIREAGEGSLGLFSLTKNRTNLCYNIVRQIGGESFNQLKTDNIIPLPVGYYYPFIYGPYEGHVFISASQSKCLAQESTCFTLEIKSLKIERVCQMGSCFMHPYFGFPPSMSQRI